MAQTKEEIKIPITNYFNIKNIKPNDYGKRWTQGGKNHDSQGSYKK